MMQSALSREVSIGILLVPHRITTFFTDDVKVNRWIAIEHFLRDLLMPKFNAFIGAKYLFHTLGYLLTYLLRWSLLMEEY